MPEKKAAAKAKAAPSHPPYAKMITDAIVAEGGKEKFAKRRVVIWKGGNGNRTGKIPCRSSISIKLLFRFRFNVKPVRLPVMFVVRL